MLPFINFPFFNHCDFIINGMTVNLTGKLQRCQNYIRFIFDLIQDNHITPYIIRSKILKLADMRSIKS